MHRFMKAAPADAEAAEQAVKHLEEKYGIEFPGALKAIPHDHCASDTQSDFLSDCPN